MSLCTTDVFSSDGDVWLGLVMGVDPFVVIEDLGPWSGNFNFIVGQGLEISLLDSFKTVGVFYPSCVMEIENGMSTSFNLSSFSKNNIMKWVRFGTHIFSLGDTYLFDRRHHRDLGRCVEFLNGLVNSVYDLNLYELGMYLKGKDCSLKSYGKLDTISVEDYAASYATLGKTQSNIEGTEHRRWAAIVVTDVMLASVVFDKMSVRTLLNWDVFSFTDVNVETLFYLEITLNMLVFSDVALEKQMTRIGLLFTGVEALLKIGGENDLSWVEIRLHACQVFGGMPQSMLLVENSVCPGLFLAAVVNNRKMLIKVMSNVGAFSRTENRVLTISSLCWDWIMVIIDAISVIEWYFVVLCILKAIRGIVVPGGEEERLVNQKFDDSIFMILNEIDVDVAMGLMHMVECHDKVQAVMSRTTYLVDDRCCVIRTRLLVKGIGFKGGTKMKFWYYVIFRGISAHFLVRAMSRFKLWMLEIVFTPSINKVEDYIFVEPVEVQIMDLVLRQVAELVLRQVLLKGPVTRGNKPGEKLVLNVVQDSRKNALNLFGGQPHGQPQRWNSVSQVEALMICELGLRMASLMLETELMLKMGGWNTKCGWDFLFSNCFGDFRFGGCYGLKQRFLQPNVLRCSMFYVDFGSFLVDQNVKEGCCIWNYGTRMVVEMFDSWWVTTGVGREATHSSAGFKLKIKKIVWLPALSLFCTKYALWHRRGLRVNERLLKISFGLGIDRFGKD